MVRMTSKGNDSTGDKDMEEKNVGNDLVINILVSVRPKEG
jgi:hypothetical protein